MNSQKRCVEKIYFGHPVNTYNTQLEQKLLSIISKKFQRLRVENPNRPTHQKGYEVYSAFGPEFKKTGMNYFYDEVLPKCSEGVFLPFEDGMFGAGVFGEMEWFYNNQKKIWEIKNSGEITLLDKLDLNRKLSIEETRRRVYSK